MNALVDKMKIIVGELEELKAEYNDKLSTLTKSQDELDANMALLKDAEVDLVAREAAIKENEDLVALQDKINKGIEEKKELGETLARYEARLVKREKGIALTEKAVDDDKKLVSKMKAELKEKRAAVDEKEKNMRASILEELSKKIG